MIGLWDRTCQFDTPHYCAETCWLTRLYESFPTAIATSVVKFRGAKVGRIIAIINNPDNIAKRSNDYRSTRLIKIQISNDRILQVDAILRNATEMGAGIELNGDLVQGEKVAIRVKNLEPISGTVAWSKQNRAGLQFDEPVDPSLLTIKSSHKVEGEGIFTSADGYHVFDRFKPVSDIKRPPMKPRK